MLWSTLKKRNSQNRVDQSDKTEPEGSITMAPTSDLVMLLSSTQRLQHACVLGAAGNSERLVSLLRKDSTLVNKQLLWPKECIRDMRDEHRVRAMDEFIAGKYECALLPDFPLHVASHNGCADVVKILIDYKAEINGVNDAKLTPLLSAVCSHHPSNECVQLLVDGGADGNAKYDGEGPFMFEGLYDEPANPRDLRTANTSALHVLALRLGMWNWGDQTEGSKTGDYTEGDWDWRAPLHYSRVAESDDIVATIQALLQSSLNLDAVRGALRSVQMREPRSPPPLPRPAPPLGTFTETAASRTRSEIDCIIREHITDAAKAAAIIQALFSKCDFDVTKMWTSLDNDEPGFLFGLATLSVADLRKDTSLTLLQAKKIAADVKAREQARLDRKAQKARVAEEERRAEEEACAKHEANVAKVEQMLQEAVDAIELAEKLAAEAKAEEEARAEAARAQAEAEAPIRAELDVELVELLVAHNLLMTVGPILIESVGVTKRTELEDVTEEELVAEGLSLRSAKLLKDGQFEC